MVEDERKPTMRFRFDRLIYEVPAGIDIEVDVRETRNLGVEIDYNFVKDGEVIPTLGGIDEAGNQLPTWDDVGIRLVEKLPAAPVS